MALSFSPKYVAPVLSSLSLVGIHLDPERDFTVEVDPLIIGDLVVWCIFIFVYLVLVVFCVTGLVSLCDRRRLCTVLLIATLVSLIRAVLTAATIILEGSALGPPPGGALVVLISVSAFMANWSLSLLFLALVLVVLERPDDMVKHVRTGTGHLSVSIGYLLFACVLVLGTASGSLIVSYEREVWAPGDTFDSIDVEDKYGAYKSMSYAHTAFWAASSVYVLWSTCRTYVRTGSIGLSSKITSIVTSVVMPIYACLVISIIAFAVLTPQSGSKTAASSLIFEWISLSDDILLNFFTAATIAALLGVGLQQTSWVDAKRTHKDTTNAIQWYAQHDAPRTASGAARRHSESYRLSNSHDVKSHLYYTAKISRTYPSLSQGTPRPR